ncbi:MAG TPA: hypothetical protein VHA12_00600 [Candidatus Nanoarchaeia archaeon]|nr:hypothetical protein [Candidatus Nanoarchaeia archaeon]
MNRRGVLDKGIEAMPIFIAVFLIMIVYALIMAGVFGTHSLSSKEAAFGTTYLPVVFEKINVENSSGQFENMTFIEGVRKHGLDEEMRSGLKEIAPLNGCLYLYYKITFGPKNDKQEAVVFVNGTEKEYSFFQDFVANPREGYMGSSQIRNYTFSFLNPEEKYYVESYLGRCIDE